METRNTCLGSPGTEEVLGTQLLIDKMIVVNIKDMNEGVRLLTRQDLVPVSAHERIAPGGPKNKKTQIEMKNIGKEGKNGNNLLMM